MGRRPHLCWQVCTQLPPPPRLPAGRRAPHPYTSLGIWYLSLWWLWLWWLSAIARLRMCDGYAGSLHGLHRYYSWLEESKHACAFPPFHHHRGPFPPGPRGWLTGESSPARKAEAEEAVGESRRVAIGTALSRRVTMFAILAIKEISENRSTSRTPSPSWDSDFEAWPLTVRFQASYTVRTNLPPKARVMSAQRHPFRPSGEAAPVRRAPAGRAAAPKPPLPPPPHAPPAAVASRRHVGAASPLHLAGM